MDKFFVKDPIDCSTGELTRFLLKKNNSLKLSNMLKSEKVNLAQQYLAVDNRRTIMFKKPNNLIGKIKYAFEKKLIKKNQTAHELDNFAIGSAISASAPSRVSSIDTNTYVKNLIPVNSTQKATLPIFNPSSAHEPSDSGSVITASSVKSERLRPTRRAPIIPPRPSGSKPHRYVEFSPIEGDRGNNSHYFEDSPVPNYRARSELLEKSKLQTMSLNPNQDPRLSREMTRNTFVDDKIKYKFDTKFDTNTISIEDFLKALDRWRCANSASDEKTILMGLANFKNISLANNISETLTYEALADFDTFCHEIKSKLGQTRREWYKVFQRNSRNKNESCYEFFAKLVSQLKMGLGITQLSSEHQTMVLEKFLSGLHPQLQGFLEIRDPEPTFFNVAEIAAKIELAQNIPRVRPIEVNNTQVQKSSQNNFVQNNQNRNSGTPRVKKEFPVCEFCKAGGHLAESCFGNKNSDRYRPEIFNALQEFRKTQPKN